MAIILDKTSHHHQNFAFTNNNRLISMVKNIASILLLVKLLNEKFTGKFLSAKVAVENAKQFSEAAARLCNITVM